MMRMLLLLALLSTAVSCRRHVVVHEVKVTDGEGESAPVESAPPAPQAETVPPAPSATHVWVGGYWAWRGAWVWVAGTYVVRPRPAAVWVPGRWDRRPRGWVWVPGHWR
jgi:hypothetical protein